MNVHRCGLYAILLATGLSTGQAGAQATAQSTTGEKPTFQVTSKLVYLDVTVLDKKGRPVTTGLTRDDFQITEDNRPQEITSFQTPPEHAAAEAGKTDESAAGGNSGAANEAAEVPPVTILVMDQLNSSLQDFAWIREQAKKFVEAQPQELSAPAELMVVGNRSMDMMLGWTRSRDELLAAVDQVPRDIPYKEMTSTFWTERIGQSLEALQQIAIENMGVPGRKNVIWLGHGAPALQVGDLPEQNKQAVEKYIHDTVNLMVEARVSLFLIYPGMPPVAWTSAPTDRAAQLNNPNASQELDATDPFAGNINFGLFADETGGKLLYNRNDVSTEMKESEAMGSEYYTLTYQPHGGDDNGRFRRIRVTLRNADLKVVTRDGYYAPDRNAAPDPRVEATHRLVEAERATTPFDAVQLTVSNVVRHPETESADFTVRFPAASVAWTANADGSSSTNLMVATASLNGDRRILSAKVTTMTMAAHTADTVNTAGRTLAFRISVRVPKKTQFVRVALETEGAGKVGAAELSRSAIDAAPAGAATGPAT
jgi:VWFA-related protein